MKSIKIVCKNEIIVLTKVSECEYKKCHHNLNGEFRKEKIVNINNSRDAITGKFWSSVDRMFEHLVSSRGYTIS